MTSSPLLRTGITVAMCAALMAGCESGEHHHIKHGGHLVENHETDENDHGILFEEGKGLLVPEAAHKMLGINTAEVTEGAVTNRIPLPLRLFNSTSQLFEGSAAIDAEQAAMLTLGGPVAFSTFSNAEPVVGRISRIEPKNVTGLAEVIVELPKIDGLKVGSFIDGTATVTNTDGALLIPATALLKAAEGEFVYVVNGEHLFRTRVVSGARNDGQLEIKDGLYSGDEVVVHPLMPLWLVELHSIRGGKSCADGH